jgi:hypothetical protein
MFRISLAVLGLGLVVPFAPAHAVLQLTADVSGVTFSCVDNAACDTDPTVGTIALANGQTTNGVSTIGSISQSVLTGLITTNTITLVNNSGALRQIDIAVSATNFVGPANFVTTTGSGTFVGSAGSTITMNWYDDPLNRQGGSGLPGSPTFAPGDLVRTFTAAAFTNSLDSFSDNFSGPLANPDPGPYSMTLTYSLSLVAGGQLNSRGEAEQKTFVPEPATMALLGSGLLGFGLIRRRRKN